MQSTTRVGVEPEPLADRGEDARVGLVVDEQVDVVERRARAARRASSVASDRRRTASLERLVAVHLERAVAVLGVDRGRAAAVGAQQDRPDAARGRRAGPTTAAPAPSANSAAVLRSSRSVTRLRRSAPITSTRSARAALDLRRGERERGEEAGAGGVDVDRAGARRAPSSCATSGAAFGHQLVGRERRDEDQVDLAGAARRPARAPARPAVGGVVRQPLVRLGDVALADAGAGDDPARR